MVTLKCVKPLFGEKNIPVEVMQKSFEPHHTSLAPQPHQKRARHCFLGLQVKVCPESSPHSHGYQMADVIPVMQIISNQLKAQQTLRRRITSLTNQTPAHQKKKNQRMRWILNRGHQRGILTCSSMFCSILCFQVETRAAISVCFSVLAMLARRESCV